MMKINQSLVVAGIAAVLSLGAVNTTNAQGQARGNFDPARAQEFRQRRMDDLKEQLEVKDDAEWKALEPLITKVMESQQQMFADRIRGAFRGGRPRDNNNNGGDNGGGRQRGGFGGEPSPEAAALQKAIESKASNSELKAALAKMQESRKAKQAELEKAQADLRKVLSLRQEAILTSSGLL